MVDGEFVVENGHVGDEAFFDLAEILDAEIAGLVVGRGLDKLAERLARDFRDVLEGGVELERRTRESAVGGETRGAVGDDDGEAAELVVAVRKAGGFHGVGDQEDLVDGLHLEGEGDHVGAEVDLVADHFDVGLVVVEACADHADFAVVELRHLVAEMRQAGEAFRLAGLVLLHGGRGVAAGRDDAGLHKLRGERDGAFRLDGVGDDGDFGDGIETFDFFEIRLAEIGGILGADAVRIDVGAFQMGTDDFRAGRLLAVGFDVLQGGGELVFGERQRRGAEGCHAFLDLGFRNDLRLP